MTIQFFDAAYLTDLDVKIAWYEGKRPDVSGSSRSDVVTIRITKKDDVGHFCPATVARSCIKILN